MGSLAFTLTLTLPGPSAGVSGSLVSYCSLKPLCSGMGEVVPARTSPTLLPHPLALCCHYPVSKCRSAWIAVTGTLRVKNWVLRWNMLCYANMYISHSFVVVFFSNRELVFHAFIVGVCSFKICLCSNPFLSESQYVKYSLLPWSLLFPSLPHLPTQPLYPYLETNMHSFSPPPTPKCTSTVY